VCLPVKTKHVAGLQVVQKYSVKVFVVPQLCSCECGIAWQQLTGFATAQPELSTLPLKFCFVMQASHKDLKSLPLVVAGVVHNLVQGLPADLQLRYHDRLFEDADYYAPSTAKVLHKQASCRYRLFVLHASHDTHAHACLAVAVVVTWHTTTLVLLSW